jgi:hypothetical protein
MFSSTIQKLIHGRIVGQLSQRVAFAVNNGTGFTEYPAVEAFVSRYRESDLIPSGTLQMGDLRVILMPDDLPGAISKLGLDDRIIIDNRYYSIVHFDDYTRRMGEDPVAIEIGCRGAGEYTGDIINNAPVPVRVGALSAPRFQAMYDRFLGPLAQAISIVQNTGTDFSAPYDTTAHVSQYKESDLIPDGSTQLGDLKVIIRPQDMPIGIDKLGLDDRLIIDGKFYGIIHYDAYTRRMAEDGVGIEITCRGGGLYEVPVTFNLIAENGDNLITEDGLFNMVSE